MYNRSIKSVHPFSMFPENCRHGQLCDDGGVIFTMLDGSTIKVQKSEIVQNIFDDVQGERSIYKTQYNMQNFPNICIKNWISNEIVQEETTVCLNFYTNFKPDKDCAHTYDMCGSPCFCCQYNEATQSMQKTIFLHQQKHADCYSFVIKNVQRTPLIRFAIYETYIEIECMIHNKPSLKFKFEKNMDSILVLDFKKLCDKMIYVCNKEQEILSPLNEPEELKSNDSQVIMKYLLTNEVIVGECQKFYQHEGEYVELGHIFPCNQYVQEQVVNMENSEIQVDSAPIKPVDQPRKNKDLLIFVVCVLFLGIVLFVIFYNFVNRE